jgi:UDP-N-acetylmuramoyl-L-alanyl-D-glutamate--2,6-diaminopimelate ligase
VAHAVQALLPLAQSRGGELTCVLGCGGDRDSSKRPLMAAAAERYAHQVVLTSDNPRNEDPQTILNHMLAGMQHAQRATVVVDRAQAIAQVVQQASQHDVVLVAGKGHEDYQDIAGVKHPFSDVQNAREALLQRAQPGRAHV